MKKKSASFERAKRLEKLLCAALERYSMEEILYALYNAGDTVEFEKAAMLTSDELITKDGGGNIIAIDMTGKGMNLFDKLFAGEKVINFSSKTKITKQHEKAIN